MGGLIVPYLAESKVVVVTIDGIKYRVPLIDSDSKLHVSPKMVGAGEVLSARSWTSSTSTTRITVATPTTGKSIRLISCMVSLNSATVSRFQVYFGTGANILTNAGKEIFEAFCDVVDEPNARIVWPDGGGPVGAVNEVVSLIADPDIGTNGDVIIHYREE